MIIAIDGPAASGKGTLGKRLAAHYGLRHLDTGLIYRAVAKALIDAGRRSERCRGRGRRRQGARSFALRRSRAQGPQHQRGGFDRFRDPGSARRRCSPSSAILPPSRRGRCSMAAISAPSSVPMPTLRSTSPRRPRCAPAAAPPNTRRKAEHIDEAAVLADIRKQGRTRPKPRRRPPETSAGRALARYDAFGYRRGHPGRHRHRRGHPSGPRARLTAPRVGGQSPARAFA